MLMIFGVDQEFEAGDNLSLEIPSEGSTVLSTTTLSFDLLSETSTQTFALGLSGSLREGDIPRGSDISTGFVEPSVKLSYSREAANARFSFDGQYRESDVSFLDPLSSLIDDTGVLVLPEDFETLNGTGTRRVYDVSTKLETGIDAPFGLVFDASASGISYGDGAAATRDDSRRHSYGVEARLRFSPVTTGFVGYDRDYYEADDLQNTEHETDAFEIGVNHEISERATIEVAIGYSETSETENFVTMNDDGLTGRVKYDLDMPNGTLNASYEVTRDQDGKREFLRFGRTLEQPLGALSFNVGATRKGSGDPKLIGGLNWRRDLPTGRITLGLNRGVTVNDDDEERISTTANFGYMHEINQLSSLGFDASYGLTESSITGNDTQRTDLTASYNYALTPDWSLSTGVSYRIRDEDRLGRTDSTSVFLRIGREFTIFQ